MSTLFSSVAIDFEVTGAVESPFIAVGRMVETIIRRPDTGLPFTSTVTGNSFLSRLRRPQNEHRHRGTTSISGVVFPALVTVMTVAGSATPATTFLAANAARFELHSYSHDASTQSFGDEAVDMLAESLGVDAAQIFKTLVVRTAATGLAVAIVPVPRRLAMKSVAAALGCAKVAMADPAAAQRSTGYVVGAISPFGQRTALPTVVDSSAMAWPRILCSGGRRGLEIAVDPADMVRLLGALVADITA